MFLNRNPSEGFKLKKRTPDEIDKRLVDFVVPGLDVFFIKPRTQFAFDAAQKIKTQSRQSNQKIKHVSRIEVIEGIKMTIDVMMTS